MGENLFLASIVLCFLKLKELIMTATLIQRTASAYMYPLLIKNLFYAPIVDNPDQEIVYRDQQRLLFE